MRTSALLLCLALAGCGACDGYAEVERARSGEVEALQVAGELGDPRIPSSSSLVDARIDEAIAAVASSLFVDDPTRRIAAVESVRLLGTRARNVYRSRFPTLLEPLLQDPLPEVRWRAAWALGRLERPSLALRAAMEDPDDRVAERAVWATGEARDEEAVADVARALDRPALERQAARALRRITGLRLETPDQWRAWAARRGHETPPGDAPVGPGD
jgi:HEAT repeat protein